MLAGGPETSTKSRFEEVRQLVVPDGRKTTAVFGGVHQNVTLVAKSAIYN